MALEQHPPRIGCVRYLNSRPLIHEHEAEVTLDHPSALARELHAGRLDAALVPVFEIFKHTGYSLVDGCGIVARGPVHSVFVAHQGPLESLHTVAIDPASLTSAHLVQVLLAERKGQPPHYRALEAGESPAPGLGVLLIGDQAFDGLRRWGRRFQYWDLGAAWWDQTSLPFVFACWAIRPGFPQATALAGQLRDWQRTGVQAIPAIAAAEPPAFRSEALRYLTDHIFFDLGEEERKGLALYGKKLAEANLVTSPVAPLAFL